MPFESGNSPQETLDCLAAKKAESNKSNSSGAQGLVLLVLAVLVIFGLCMGFQGRSGGSAAEPNRPSALKDAPVLPYHPEETITQAKAYMASKQYQLALDELEGLRPVDSKRSGVQSMVTRATHEVQLADLKERRLDRLAYAKDYERSLLAAGMDATVRATGSNADTMTVTFVLVSRPLVYQIENDHDVSRIWLSHGFTHVHLSDGFGSSWSYKL